MMELVSKQTLNVIPKLHAVQVLRDAQVYIYSVFTAHFILMSFIRWFVSIS